MWRMVKEVGVLTALHGLHGIFDLEDMSIGTKVGLGNYLLSWSSKYMIHT